MEIGDIERFAEECRHIYSVCCDFLGYEESRLDLNSLLNEARQGRIPRRGNFTINDVASCTFHIHGIGYTFTEVDSGKSWGFDVYVRDGAKYITISPWKFTAYLIGMGRVTDESEVTSGLLSLAAETNKLLRIEEGPHSLFCFPITSSN